MAEIIRFQFRRGTAAEWAQVNPILADGEAGLETDTRRHKFGNGVSPWTALDYAAPGPEGPPNTDASLLSTGTVPEERLPSRLSEAAQNATYVLKTDLPPNTLDGGNASSTYGTSFNLDGGSAA